jgi:hypothetical protein
MSVNEEKKNMISPERPKRSSLKMSNIMDPNEILNYSKKKRNSVSFQLGGNFKYKELRAKFDDIKKEEKNPIQQKNFNEARKKSIKNEFALVKEMLKNKVIEEDESESEEVKENTDKNIKVGKEYEDSESDTQSKNSENENNDDKKSENENNDDKKNENEEKKTNQNEEEKKEENQKKNDEKNGEENEDEESIENDEIEAPKTNRQEKQELENKRECNQMCKFC